MTGNGHKSAPTPRMRPAIRVVHATLLTTITHMMPASCVAATRSRRREEPE
jgi:hypothetical protein